MASNDRGDQTVHRRAISRSAWLFVASAAIAQEAATERVAARHQQLCACNQRRALATAGLGEITLGRRSSPPRDRRSPAGWSGGYSGPQPGPDGKLPLIAPRKGGSSVFQLEPGSYLVHASFGRAGATKRITVGHDSKRESVVLDAGGLKLNAMLAGGKRDPLVAAEVLDLRSKADAKASGR